MWGNGDNGTNTSGFYALPAGYSNGGASSFLGTYAFFGSATEINAGSEWTHGLTTGDSQSFRNINGGKQTGWSVRCLQD
jgi:uncharacterized protein (TIGR02145 family)